jgi:hypothetical protein
LVNRLVAALLMAALAVVVLQSWLWPRGCPYAMAYGHPCVCCGVTRDVLLMARGHRPCHNPCTLLYIAWFLFEVGFRLAGGFLRRPRAFAVVDAATHAVWFATWLVRILPYAG